MSSNDDKELAALRALISASLRVGEADMTEEEVELFLKQAGDLPMEFIAALEQATTQDMFEEREHAHSPQFQQDAAHSETGMALYSAMNRKNAENEHSAQTESELERRRKEILKKLRGESVE